MHMFVNNNFRFCCTLCIWKIINPEIFLEEYKYVKENIKTKNCIDKELKSESDSNSDSNSDNDSGINDKE